MTRSRRRRTSSSRHAPPWARGDRNSPMRYVLACCLAGLLGVAQAAGADEFYRGKTITIVTSTGPGGTYDLVARLIARHMPRHVPDTPSMVVQNMPGGGNVVATNYLYNLAPKDGTVIGTIN